jgi:ferredoxin--NADP+ reductase
VDAEGKPHKLRLYSIASPAIGDDGQGKTLSVCVKRANTIDPVTGVVYKGVCSNYLCDLKPGDTVQATGPVGKAFLMPEIPNANMIMIATGTGIAPFRAFLKVRYEQQRWSSGESWLFFGVQTQKDYLYADELEAKHEGYHLVTAFSREQKTADGQRMYVQHRLIEHAKPLLELLQKKETYLYICGLKGMETGILQGFQAASQECGVDWDLLLTQMKADKRWRVEVY